MKYSLDFGLWNSVFAVPTQIVDQHIKMCGAAHLKVLLVLLRNAGSELQLTDIAALLNLSAGDTQDALNYWIQAGVLCAQPGPESTVLNVGDDEPAPVQPAAGSPMCAPNTEVQQKTEKVRVKHSVGSAPLQKPRPAEIAKMIEHSSELKSLLSEAEAALGKTLTSSDISTLAALYDWAGISVAVLLTVIEYCKQIGKTNLRYIEKVAINWQERGIDTFDKAERFIKESLETDAQTKLIKTAFGIYDRALTSKENEFVKAWFHDYKFDIPVIKLAYERSIEHTGKVSFPYINKVLTNWHSQNITTPEQATKEEAAFARQKTEREKPKSSYDIDELEQFFLHNSPK
ncbi:DnaD/phage-associated family protein [Hydrogenoanaerobacterium saccharovorans]|uniref:DnaD and phage-associated domain-containing protein n=1 Tax=Hydrogenoanaerobacterium saccharovorans TaxID=474960 RepID=A0A1H7ZXB1_9FIRM|nr:DnaD domain protein [Hydrogenoanaerobacterium saccharovorans]RPF48362.1 DnaD/phage-associated family protein [Hydrogenoanaerobacterium saccharovorans]SEM62228.1 DnaD and phage-associated domain-containing protein [Hydrogenoanaerobacterium saccharovorans]